LKDEGVQYQPQYICNENYAEESADDGEQHLKPAHQERAPLSPARLLLQLEVLNRHTRALSLF